MESITMSGKIISIEELKTKRGNVMGFINLGHTFGSIEAIVFPDLYESIRGTLKVGDDITVIGLWDVTGWGKTICCDEVGRLSS